MIPTCGVCQEVGMEGRDKIWGLWVFLHWGLITTFKVSITQSTASSWEGSLDQNTVQSSFFDPSNEYDSPCL